MPVVKRTMEEWRAVLAEQRASGQRQKEWCAANGVNLYTLRDRASQLKRQDREAAVLRDLRYAVSAGWVEVRPESLDETEELAALVTSPGGHLPAAPKEAMPAHEPEVTEAVAEKKLADIRLTRGEWTVTVTAGFEAGLLTEVLRVVNRVCC